MMLWAILLVFGTLWPPVTPVPLLPEVGDAEHVPGVRGSMPCYPFRLSDIENQTWASYTCIETQAFVRNVRARDYEGHEQVHLVLSDDEGEMPAFWPAQRGRMAEGQYVRVRAMLVPMVNGGAVLGWGLLIIQWEPSVAPLAGTRQS
jgi:hypothetical protein